MNKKLKIVIPLIVVLVAGIIAAFFLFNKEDGYRAIQVYQVNGDVTLERENIGIMEAYENLNLISGDVLETFLESFLRLKLDEDKYILVEQESQIGIYAMGDDKNSKTNIRLEKGAVTVEVEDKLADDASFEVTTPNMVMAIRGTVFRVTADVDEKGQPITRITIFEGAVTVQKKAEDGTLSEETLIESGKEAIIYEDNKEEVLVVVDEIDDTLLPKDVLKFLQEEVVSDNHEIVYSEEKIIELIEKIENSQETESSEEPESSEKPEEPENSEELENSEEPEDSQEPENSEEPEDSQEPENSEKPEDSQKPEPASYTVTFMYKGTVFGTQVVKEGTLASKPKLKPAPTGSWNYDFSKPITKDTIIEFED